METEYQFERLDRSAETFEFRGRIATVRINGVDPP